MRVFAVNMQSVSESVNLSASKSFKLIPVQVAEPSLNAVRSFLSRSQYGHMIYPDTIIAPTPSDDIFGSLPEGPRQAAENRDEPKQK